MKGKWPLYLGILLLTIGIVFRKATDFEIAGLIMIITGVVFKTYYIISKIRNKEYSPGYEVIILVVGLGMFLTGLYFKNVGSDFDPLLLIVPGLSLKVVFIILFIRKVRQSRLG